MDPDPNGSALFWQPRSASASASNKNPDPLLDPHPRIKMISWILTGSASSSASKWCRSTTLLEAHAHVTASALWTYPVVTPRQQMLVEEQLPPTHGEKKDCERENVVTVVGRGWGGGGLMTRSVSSDWWFWYAINLLSTFHDCNGFFGPEKNRNVSDYRKPKPQSKRSIKNSPLTKWVFKKSSSQSD